MAVKHIFQYSMPDGGPVVYFADWIATLSAEEQQVFQESKIRQENYRQAAIDRGDMVIEPGSGPDNGDKYVWRDEETAKRNKPYDTVWRSFWDRYLAETGVIFEIVELVDK